MKLSAKRVKIVLAVLVVMLVLIFCFFQIYTSFNRRGLDTGLAGLTEGDRFPNWVENEEVSQLDCEVLSKDRLLLSKVYLIKRADHFQIRFRVAYGIPFLSRDIWSDMAWTIQDSAGNSYTNYIIVYGEQIAGLDCINVTLLMDEDAFSTLSDGKLTISAVCSDDGSSDNIYAHCEAELAIPAMDF